MGFKQSNTYSKTNTTTKELPIRACTEDEIQGTGYTNSLFICGPYEDLTLQGNANSGISQSFTFEIYDNTDGSD